MRISASSQVATESASVNGLDLVVDELTAGYGPVVVVRDVNLTVRQGEFVSLLGANGVGKTTLLRALIGDADVSSGTIRFGRRSLEGLRPFRVTREGIAIVPEGRALVPDISVRDNLLLGSVQWNKKYKSAAVDRAAEEIYERFPVLGRRRFQLAGSLSGGEQQMLAIGRALMAKPKLLLLDEPSLGLAPQLITRVFDDLAAANREGLTILVAEQNAAAALRVCDRSLVMSGGRIVSERSGGSGHDTDDLRAAFLGVSRRTSPTGPDAATTPAQGQAIDQNHNDNEGKP